MKSKILLLALTFVTSLISYSQNQIIYPQGGVIGSLSYIVSKEIMPEHGFLPGKKFPTYPTVNKFDFKDLKLKVILNNDRDDRKLTKINCSKAEIDNKTELKADQGTVKVWDYLNKLIYNPKL